jgi:alcohol dehydrogenase
MLGSSDGDGSLYVRRLLDLVRSWFLHISVIGPRVYKVAALPEAMGAAATAGSLDCIVVQQ